ncbi:MAG: DUF4080 domain-containing protein [Thermoclostridium sp.]|nr:DUF4080 domain-containing protein [Thermoclostridium sp.]
MKTLLVAINSQYVHSNLAVRYLKAACSKPCGEVTIMEFSINEALMHIFSSIVREAPDVVAFSCYIWNIELVVKLCSDLRKSNPEIILIAGGPEVSFDQGGFPEGCLDYLIAGEGEEKLPFLLQRLNCKGTPDSTETSWLQSFTTVESLETLPSPYSAGLKLENRIAYIEASRGCPFRCAYCISSITGGVRYFPLKQVFAAIEILVGSGTRIIKFVDRTFNANEQRALKIWNHLLQYAHQGIVFHFEIDPGLLSENMLNCLGKMPAGLVQLEAGIQSIHPETLEAVHRPRQIEKALQSLSRVISYGNIHIHVDLIAGLPYESYSKFRQSFNLVMGLHAHHFQLGFLKLLHGSAIRQHACQYDYQYRAYPPYEVISSRDINAREMIRLKDIEACVELFNNSGRFVMTFNWIEKQLKIMDYFTFYESLSSFMRSRGELDRPVKAVDLYRILLEFIQQSLPALSDEVCELMRLDYLCSFKNPSVPLFLRRNPDADPIQHKQKRIEKYSSTLEKTLPRLLHHSIDSIWRQIHIDEFHFPVGFEFPKNAVIVVDFGEISPVTDRATAYLLDSPG